MLGFSARCCECKTPGVMLSMHNSLSRPHIEYEVQFSSLYYKRDIELFMSASKRDENHTIVEGTAI